MGIDANCCRRPQGLGKRDLKTYRGIQQKNNDDFPSSFNEDTFKVYNQEGNNFDQNSNGYLNSIYSTNNDVFSTTQYQNYSNISGQISEPIIYSNQLTYPTQEYSNSYTTFPQQNIISNDYIDNYSSTQYIQSHNEYSLQNDYNIDNISSNEYISSDPFQYNNFTSNESYNNQPFEFSSVNALQSAEYATSNGNDYSDINTQSFTNYESQPYTETYPQNSNQYNQYSEYQTDYISEPSNQYNISSSSSTQYISSDSVFQDNQYTEEPIHYNNSQNQYFDYQQQNVFSQPQQNQFIETKPIIKNTIYVSKPFQYSESQTQMQNNYSPLEEQYPEIQREPEYNLSDFRPREQQNFYEGNKISSNEDTNSNGSFDEENNNNIRDDEDENEDIFREKEKENDSDVGKDYKSSSIEKKKENTACQVPGFISNFFSKIFK